MAEDIRTIELKVAGMTCVMCAGAIEDALKRLDGITGANVNLSSEKVNRSNGW
ncbi:MAG: heavy metal-associated domain-containing protein [Euryarchaeota archaeon]|nr:heavy metal-associated domain-containing protein [Euryarchaeota archaeon]